MSQTILFKIDQTGRFFEEARFRDAMGTCPLIWNIISQKILGERSKWVTSIKEAEKVWHYWKNPECSEAEAFALLCTFDKAVIEGHKFREAILMIENFFKEHPVDEMYANNFQGISEYCEKKADDGLLGICFHHNTLSPNPWDNEEGREYNFISGEEHFGVFASLKNKELVLPEKMSKKFAKK